MSSKLDGAKDEHAQDQGVEHGDRRAFGRRDEAAHDAAQDDHRHHQRGQAVLEGHHDAEQARALPALGQIQAPAQAGDDGHAEQAHHQPRQDAGGKQAGDRHAHHRAVDHHQVGRRNRRADDRAGHHHGAGKGLLVAVLFHRRHHRAAEGRRFRDGGAGDAREQHRGDHARVGHAAAQVADQRVGELGQAVGDARLVHQLAGEDEQRHGQEGEQVQAGEIALRRHRQHLGAADLHDAHDAGDAEHVADRHADGQQEEESRKYPDHHSSPA